jgi:pimeloyl-ACP methyl ester carboxylesterase
MKHKYKIIFATLITFCLLGVNAAGQGARMHKVPGAKDTVIVLHGIGHSRLNMAGVAYALRKAGYNTLSISYPSRSHKIAELSDFIAVELNKNHVWKGSGKIHFVTHSMGGLVTRQYLEDYKKAIPQERLGRIVMLAPPLGGSEVADFLENFPPYKWMFGAAGLELTTANQRKKHFTPYYDVGIIAGTTGWPYLIASAFMPARHDGRVSVESTKWRGMKDHLTTAATHSFISWKPFVHKHIIHFINEGEFDHEA